MGIMRRDGVPPPGTWEPRHMVRERLEKPKLQSPDKLAALRPWPPLVLVAGIGGSGRTEWLLSLASVLSGPEQPLYLSDLTEERSFLCNPVVAVRIRRTMPGVRVLDPDTGDGDDAGVIESAIGRAAGGAKGRVLLDIGANVPGASLLRGFKESFAPGGCDFLLVVNPLNPRTAGTDNVRALRFLLEDLSGLPVTGLVVDPYNGPDDEPRLCAEGALSALAVAQELELPLLYVLADEGIAEKISALLPAELPVWSLPYCAGEEGGNDDVSGWGL